MLSKESKIRVLENFYGIDYVIFGKALKDVQNCCPIIKEEYISVKGALLSVYVEMLKLIGHKPDVLEEKVTPKDLLVMAKESAKNARHASQKVVTTEQARADIKAELKEALTADKDADVGKLVEAKIREKAYRLAIDNLLVARALHEGTSINELNEWTGKIVEDSYKILRDNLCEIAIMILNDDQPE